jgi:hypothetical protein
MYVGIKKWGYDEWLSSAAISLFLALHLVIAGYPIILWDSARYLGSSLFLNPDYVSLSPVSYLLKPLITLAGAWGFAFFQIAILTYVTVSVLKFFNKNFTVGVIAILVSAAGYFAVQVMMDIYTAAGFLALFLVLNEDKDIFLYAILSICYVAHYENIFLFPLCAGIYWAIFDRKKFNLKLLPMTFLFLILVIGVFSANYLAENDFRFFPKVRYSMCAARIMADSPEIARSYMEKYPDSGFSKRKKLYEYAKTQADPFHVLLWDAKEGIGLGAGFNNFDKESKKFTSYALKNYKLTLFKNALKNTYRFLIKPGHKIGGESGKEPIEQFIGEFIPGQLAAAKNSLQYKGILSLISFELVYAMCSRITFPIIIFFIFLSFIKREIKNLKYYPFVVLTAIFILINAFAMSNFINIYLRYQLRVMLLPSLAASLIVADFLRHRKV